MIIKETTNIVRLTAKLITRIALIITVSNQNSTIKKQLKVSKICARGELIKDVDSRKENLKTNIQVSENKKIVPFKVYLLFLVS